MTLISTIGIWSKTGQCRWPRQRRYGAVSFCKSRDGFTLLELLVVLVLIVIIVGVTVPRFGMDLLNDPLKKSTRDLVYLIKGARERALTVSGGAMLSIDISAGEFSLTNPDPQAGAIGQQDEPVSRTIELPDTITILSVFAGDGDRPATGPVEIWFSPQGMAGPFIVNLTDGSSVMGVDYSPFLTDIRIEDEQLEPTTYELDG
jgi:prepilin-type N-terminal cleavage/methylation domain-containing protein